MPRAGTINNASGSFDEFIYSYNPTHSTTGWTVVRVGYDNRNEPTSPQPSAGVIRPLLYFPDVALPDGAQVTKATTRVRVSAVYGSPGSKYLVFYRVNVPWGTNTVAWNDIVPSGYDSADQSAAYQGPSSPAAGNSYTIDMTNIGRSWYTRRNQDWKFDTGLLMRMCTEHHLLGHRDEHDEQLHPAQVQRLDDRLPAAAHHQLRVAGGPVGLRNSALGANYAPSTDDDRPGDEEPDHGYQHKRRARPTTPATAPTSGATGSATAGSTPRATSRVRARRISQPTSGRERRARSSRSR